MRLGMPSTEHNSLQRQHNAPATFPQEIQSRLVSTLANVSICTAYNVVCHTS